MTTNTLVAKYGRFATLSVTMALDMEIILNN